MSYNPIRDARIDIPAGGFMEDLMKKALIKVKSLVLGG